MLALRSHETATQWRWRKHSVGNSRYSNPLSSVGAEEEQRNSSFIRADLTSKRLEGLQYNNQPIYDYYKKDLVSSVEMITLARNMYKSEKDRKYNAVSNKYDIEK